MKLLGKLRNRLKNKKGFTLVELIVVIVIIAILAALVVPALMNYIEKAKDQQRLADARSVYIAAQTVATEAYAKNDTDIQSSFTGYTYADGLTGYAAQVSKLGATKDKAYAVELVVTADYQVTNFVFTSGDEKATISYVNDAWDIVKK